MRTDRLLPADLRWTFMIQLRMWNWSSTHKSKAVSQTLDLENCIWETETFSGLWWYSYYNKCRNRWLWVVTEKYFPLKLYPKVHTTNSRIPQIWHLTSLTFSNKLFILYLLILEQYCSPCFSHYLLPDHQFHLRPRLPDQSFCFPFRPSCYSMRQAYLLM